MRIRSLTIAAACAGALLAPAAAAAHAAPLTVLKVRDCRVGDSADARQATFYARMRAVPHAARMMLRFKLYDRAGHRTPQPIDSPALEQWRASRPGVSTFGYAQKVTALDAGGLYTVAVEYRWLDARGKTIRDVRRRSGECRELGQLPNLTITRIAGRPGSAGGTESYSVDVLNDGTAEARLALIDIFVDGAQADVAQLAVIEPAETETVHVTGPTCRRRIRVAVDRLDTIHETTDDDNVVRSRCPALSA